MKHSLVCKVKEPAAPRVRLLLLTWHPATSVSDAFPTTARSFSPYTDRSLCRRKKQGADTAKPSAKIRKQANPGSQPAPHSSRTGTRTPCCRPKPQPLRILLFFVSQSFASSASDCPGNHAFLSNHFTLQSFLSGRLTSGRESFVKQEGKVFVTNLHPSLALFCMASKDKVLFTTQDAAMFRYDCFVLLYYFLQLKGAHLSPQVSESCGSVLESNYTRRNT